MCILCVFVLYCICVILLWARWGGPDGIEAYSLGPIFHQCFDTVGWVIWPVIIRPQYDIKPYSTFPACTCLTIHTLRNYITGELMMLSTDQIQERVKHLLVESQTYPRKPDWWLSSHMTPWPALHKWVAFFFSLMKWKYQVSLCWVKLLDLY